MSQTIDTFRLLVTRFLAVPAFNALYEQKLHLIYGQVFVEEFITQRVEQYAELMYAANQERDLVVLEDYERAVASVLDFVARRYDYLAATTLLGEQSNLLR